MNASPGTVPTQPPRENGAAEHSEGTILTGAPPGNFVAAVEEDHAAVAEDATYTLEYFQKFGELNFPNRKHGLVLKWLRSVKEFMSESSHVFHTTMGPVHVPPLIHYHGTSSCAASSLPWKWRWQEMAAMLDDESMR